MDMFYKNNVPNIAFARDIVSKISFPHFPLPINVRLLGAATIEVTVETQDREAKKKGVPPARVILTSRKEVPPWFQGPQDTEAICRWVLDEVMCLLRHEVDEHFLLDGNRMFDPHKPSSQFPSFNPQQALGDLFPGAGLKSPH